MAKRLPIKPGDVVLIPLTESRAVVGKILYLYVKRFKGVMIVGVVTEREFDPRTPPEPRVGAWQLVKFTMRSAVDSGHWKLLGHDPAPIPAEATMYRMAGDVFQAEELVREETAADIKRIPVQAIGGPVATEYHVRSLLGIEEPVPPPRPSKKQKQKAPLKTRTTPADEDRFWSLIEDAWTKAAPALAKKRPGIAAKVSAKGAEALSAKLDDVIASLEKALRKLKRNELIAFDRTLERKLYELDRKEVQRHTDGSDDGFLYARGFIVGMGRPYYDLVCGAPSKAISDMEAETITYLPHRVFEERFDEDLPPSKISRETGSNKAGWR